LLPKLPGFYPLFKIINLEKGLALGLALLMLGIGVMLYAVYQSQTAGFETIGFVRSVRLVFGGSLAVILGVQVNFRNDVAAWTSNDGANHRIAF